MSADEDTLRPYAKKSLGQHFLHDKNICRRIAGLLQTGADDIVVEIGPGPGSLTNILEEMPHKILFLLEKDIYWARDRAKNTDPRTQSILIDALKFNWSRLAQHSKVRIIGNLPYNVASPLIWNILSFCPSFLKAVFMVQKEVGQRLTARPGSKNYGALSVWTQSHSSPRLEFFLAPGAFKPPPKVDSAIVSFAPVSADCLPADAHALRHLLNLCFQNRRKQMTSIFRRANLPEMENAMALLGIDGKARPENISCKEFQALSAYYRR